MKKICLTAFLLISIAHFSFSQNALPDSGFVGINTTSPQTTLDIENSGNGLFLRNHLTTAFSGSFLRLYFSRGTSSAPIALVNGDRMGGTNFNGYDGTNYLISASIESNVDGTVATGSMPSRIVFQTTSTGGTARVERMRITSSGSVCIGNTNPQGYMLAVAGSAVATAVTVKLQANWPDYVFKKDYRLPALGDLKAFIDQNHHLPEMPTEAEVAKDGLNLGEVDKLLTKKVEELTLYLIDKDKEVKEERRKESEQGEILNAQQAQLSAQQVQIDKLSKQLEQLSKKLAAIN